MLLAMGTTAFLCVFLGCFPQLLYSILPNAVEYHPYKLGHVVTQYQLLLFAALAFALLLKLKIYPPELR